MELTIHLAGRRLLEIALHLDADTTEVPDVIPWPDGTWTCTRTHVEEDT